MCRACRIQTTVTAGTMRDKSRTPLRVWLAAMGYVTNQKPGVSALGLQRVLGLESDPTAGAILPRLRVRGCAPDATGCTKMGPGRAEFVCAASCPHRPSTCCRLFANPSHPDRSGGLTARGRTRKGRRRDICPSEKCMAGCRSTCTPRCRAYLASPRYSSAGYSEPIMARSRRATLTILWTNSSLGSIPELHDPGDRYPTDLWSRPSLRLR